MSNQPRLRLSARPLVFITAALLALSALPLVGAMAAGGPASTAPVPAEDARSTHAPFEAADCSLCHEGRDTKRPGKALEPVDSQCMSCHDEIRDADGARSAHARGADCVRCHNPHNSRRPHLLR